MTGLATPDNRLLLAGRWVAAPRSRAVADPESGRPVALLPLADAGHVEQALQAAQQGRRQARALPVHERQRILMRAADAVERDAPRHAQVIATEGIKTIREARAEVTRAVGTLRLAAHEAARLEGETVPFGHRPGSEARTGYFSREPLGLVAAITPYNDPLNLVVHKVAPAIASGNAIILKPHEQTPTSALLLAAVLLEAGLPDCVLQVLTGEGAEVGPSLVSDPRVRMVSFTGGPVAGASIARAAGMKRLAMEIGGNCPTLVMPDAHLGAAVAASVAGAYAAAGQNCLHVQRLLVHADVYGEVRERFVHGARSVVAGSRQDEATDMGCLVSELAARRVKALLADACRQGARVLAGGTHVGSLFQPTLVDNVPPQHALMREEVFAPITCLVPFELLDQAIALANAVDQGLHAAIFTADLDTAFAAVEQLDAGAVLVNDSTDYRMDGMPFGGVRGSGFGREGVRWTVQEMTEPKVACFRRLTAVPGAGLLFR